MSVVWPTSSADRFPRIFGQFIRDAMKGRQALSFPAPDPREIGNKQMTITPSSSPSGSSTTTELIPGDPGDGGVVDPNDPNSTDPTRPRRTTTTNGSPPSTQPGCEEPDNWPDDYPPFCS